MRIGFAWFFSILICDGCFLFSCILFLFSVEIVAFSGHSVIICAGVIFFIFLLHDYSRHLRLANAVERTSSETTPKANPRTNKSRPGEQKRRLAYRLTEPVQDIFRPDSSEQIKKKRKKKNKEIKNTTTISSYHHPKTVPSNLTTLIPFRLRDLVFRRKSIFFFGRFFPDTISSAQSNPR